MKARFYYIGAVILLGIMWFIYDFNNTSRGGFPKNKFTGYSELDPQTGNRNGLVSHLVLDNVNGMPIFVVFFESSVDYYQSGFSIVKAHDDAYIARFSYREVTYSFNLPKKSKEEDSIKGVLVEENKLEPSCFLADKKQINRIFELTKKRVIHDTWEQEKKIFQNTKAFILVDN